MDTIDVTSQLLSMRAAGTRQAAQIAILKKGHEMQMSLINMIAEVAQSAPPPSGQGLVVDKRA